MSACHSPANYPNWTTCFVGGGKSGLIFSSQKSALAKVGSEGTLWIKISGIDKTAVGNVETHI